MDLVLLRNVYRNLGDEAMLAAEIALLRPYCGDGLTVLTDEPQRVQSSYGVRAAYSDVTLINPWQRTGAQGAERWMWRFPSIARPLRNLRNRAVLGRLRRDFLRAVRSGSQSWPGAQAGFVHALQSADVVVMGGGMVPSVQHVERARIATLEALAAWGKPVVLHGVTVFRRNQPEAAYRLARTLITRDRASRDNAISCSFPAGSIVEGIDPAFSLPQALESETAAFLAAKGLQGVRFAAVNWRSGLDFQIEPSARYIRQLADQGRFDRVLLFSMQHHGAENDVHSLRKLQPLLGDLVAAVVEEWPSPALLKAVLARAEWVAACRYHAAVFALTVGRPLWAISVNPEYDAKLGGILDQFDRAHWMQPSQGAAASPAALIPEWFHPETHAQLCQRTTELRTRQSALITALDSMVGESTTPSEASRKERLASGRVHQN